jgi:hypothetical protein
MRSVLWEGFGGTHSGSIYPKELEQHPSVREFGFTVDPADLEPLRESDEVTFVKTHALTPPDDSPAIYMVRDGRDAIASYARFAIEMGAEGFEGRSFEDAAEALIAERGGEFGGWSGNVRSWTRRDAPTAIVRFEELIADPIPVAGAALRRLGLRLAGSGEPATFQDLHAIDPLMFQRGRVDGWRAELPDSLQRLFWRIHGAEMLLLGYPPQRLPVSAAFLPGQ